MITIEYVRERLAELREERLRHKAGSGSAAKGGSKGTRTRKAAKRGGGGRAATGRPGAALSQKAAKKTAAKAAKKAAAAKKTVKITAIKATKKAAKKATTKSATRTVAAKASKKTAKKATKKAASKSAKQVAASNQTDNRTERRLRLATFNARKFQTLASAESALNSNRMMVPILRGRDGRYWVAATNKEAGVLIRAGVATVERPNTVKRRS